VKKIVVSLILLTFLGMSEIMAEPSTVIDITGISSDNGLISVETFNGLQTDTIFTMTVVKEGNLNLSEAMYCTEQQKVKAGNKAIFKFIIPDEREGVVGSGRYKVTLLNKSRNMDEKTFEYADGNSIKQFFLDLKTAADRVTDPTKAYEEFKPLITEGIVFSLGIDYEQYSQKSETVKNNTMNVLYESGVDKLSAETLPEEFTKCFAVSVYNGGEKVEGLELLSLTYNGKTVDKDVIGDAAENMSESYQTLDDFKNAATEAYGLALINKANSGNIEEAVLAYKSETDNCDDTIDKINTLTGRNKITAYDYIILSLNNNKVKTPAELETLLKAAYTKAKQSDTNSSGGGNGGSGGSSGGGGGSNKTPPKSGSVSTTAGVQTSSDKNEKEDSYIFTDMPVEHWAAESVARLKTAGIINGTDTGEFEPDRYVTREEFAKVLVVTCGLSLENVGTMFADAESNAWYIPYIGAAADNGIVNGIGDNKFGVGQTITRQEMAVMTSRALKLKKNSSSKLREYKPFDDESDIADYAIGDIKLLFELGVINGKEQNIFAPLGSATRAEAAKIIYEAFRGEW